MPRQPQPAPFDGALVINKPKGKTSHDVVDAVRHLAGFRQIGHLGTLDPLATGVLVLLLGRATRLVQFYIWRPRWGKSSDAARISRKLRGLPSENFHWSRPSRSKSLRRRSGRANSRIA